MKTEDSKAGMDLCVICGERTNEPKDKNVSLRYYYIEGAGQLCQKCFFESNQNFKS